ncbi:MAG: sulfite oxidase-like oxidoreductase [Candidatus Bipolaricaulis sp.]|nr:sulfite oxidase-like oxidoreductase [Candidatus Bipolaricaulis sp.]
MLNTMRIKRLPPGQSWVEEPMVYDIGPVPPARLEDYRLRLSGEVTKPIELDWSEVQALPRTHVRRDFHCVTTWSVRGIVWEGIPTRILIDRVSVAPDVRWVLVRCRDGYSTDVPIDAFARRDALLADRMNGSILAPEHGAPLRLVVPCLYAWKSAKYVEELEFLSERRPGFWEQRGYHDRGDPWREERFRANPRGTKEAGA